MALRLPGQVIVGAGFTCQVNGVVVAATLSSSVIVTRTFGYVVAVVGVPLMTPVVALMVRPAGALAIEKVHGVLGQVDAIARLVIGLSSAEVWVPGVVIVGGPTMVQVKLADPVRPNASVTVMVSGVAVTFTVGVPVTRPEADSVRPMGRVPAVICQVLLPTPVPSSTSNWTDTVAPRVLSWLPGPSTSGSTGGSARLVLKTGSSSWLTSVEVT